jgi:phosphoglycolate phosphatase
LNRFANVLLDLDGTVTDPFEGIAGSIQHAMRSMGLEPPSENDLRGAVGPPLRQSFGRFLATNDMSRIEEALRFYRERFSATGFSENRVYPDISEMLADLTASGFRLYLATSKPSIYAQKIIHHFGLTKYFLGIYGSELDGRHENKGDLLRFLLDSEGLNVKKTAMVGDRSHDMLGAKANNLCAVGVTWGYGSREELEDGGADVICGSPSEVFRFLLDKPNQFSTHRQ